jgi:autotransporter translocation and assembly factor TamB
LAKSAVDSLLESSGFLPMTISLLPYEADFHAEEPLEFKMSTRGMDIGFIQPFFKGVKNIAGVLVADIVLSNSLNNLRGIGPVRLLNGNFDIPEMGTKYRKMNLVLLLNDREIVIHDFKVRSGKGELKIVEGGLSLSDENVEGFTAKFVADNFLVIDNKMMTALASGELEFAGSFRFLEVSGELTVDQARMNYQEWFQEPTHVALTAQPFFVIAEDLVAFDTTGAMRFQKEQQATEEDFTESQFYKNIRGEIAFYFPRNSWVRSSDTNIEVEGEFVAVKEGPRFVLFGSFATIRGFYELLGNRFQIDQGEMVFVGSPDHNPEVAMQASYTFKDPSSDDQQSQEFQVAISGTLYEPEFQFTLDGKEARQQDVVSILLFGQKYDALSFGQRSNVPSNNGIQDRATGLLTGQILKQLSRSLGQELSLDVIQIEKGKNLMDAKLRVGKYVTPDVFVSVSQDFGAEGNQMVELEYEIPKKILFFNLFLQASQERRGNSAMDVFWKIEW